MYHKLIITIFFVCSLLKLAYADYKSANAAYEAGNYETAFKEFLYLAEKGDARAQNDLGHMYLEGWGVSKDYTEAVKWYRRAAEQGNAGGQNDLGYMYEKGISVAQDYAEASKWYRKAAEQGFAEAQSNLSYMYFNGYGVEQDNIQAYAWYGIAAASNGDNIETIQSRNHIIAVPLTWYCHAGPRIKYGAGPIRHPVT